MIDILNAAFDPATQRLRVNVLNPTPIPTPTLYVHPTDVQIEGALSIEKTACFESVIHNGNGGAAKTIDWTAGNYQSIVLDSTPTALTFTPPPGIASVHLFLIQDSGGSKTVTWPTIKWAQGVVPTLSSAGDAVDIVTLVWTGSEWYGAILADFK